MSWSSTFPVRGVALLFGLVLLLASPGVAGGGPSEQAQYTRPDEEPYVVEYYYKVKWGHFEEFLELYKRNHYPVLLKEKELGRIIGMSAVSPVYHAGEGSRWDFRFTIVWKSARVAHEEFDNSAIIRSLYPDQEKFRKEEQRRFEILLEHMDVPLTAHDLGKW